MASTISAISSLHSISRTNSHGISAQSSSSSSLRFFPIRNFCFLRNEPANKCVKDLAVVKKHSGMRMIIRAVDEETLAPEEEAIKEGGLETAETPSPEQPVSVPVSPSDILTMFFQAEGTMNETAIPTVTKALGETDGIANVRVQVLEGIASVELTKQTTVQATGVASSLLEIIQGSGFKLQTLNLSFEDEEDISE